MSGDSPGASARREYERRRAARKAAVRARWPRIGGLLLALRTAPAHERAWLRGAEGEERAAARLTHLLRRSEVILMHDRRLPSSRANIDHIAVGPGGITVIDTKRLAGKVEVRGRGKKAQLRVGNRDCTRLLEGVARQVAVVSAVVEDVEVRGALCFVDVNGLPLVRRLRARDILIDGPRGVARLAKRSGRMERQRVIEVAALIDRRFPRAGV
jgi:hypothetical protein